MRHSTTDDPNGELIRRRLGLPAIDVSHSGWSLQVRGDEVADIALHGVPLLRAIRPVIRDRDWNTVPVRVLEVEQLPDGLVITLSFDDHDIRFDAQLAVRLNAHTLEVHLRARAIAPCLTNRAGLVILHPAADAGSRVAVLHTDGSVEQTKWPVDISAHQPFRNIAGFSWNRRGIHATLNLSGDVFETEDQRNWTDASFKTYGTPLDRPYPVMNATGFTIDHTAVLQATGRPIPARTPPKAEQVVIANAVVGHVPPISLGAASYPAPSTAPWRRSCYEAVMVELTGAEKHWSGLLDAAVAQADSLRCGLDVRIVTDRPDVIERWVDQLPASVQRIGTFDPRQHISTEPLWRALRDAVASAAIQPTLVGGTRAHYTELNRRLREVPADVAELTFSITPQMHAQEIPHIVESLACQRIVARNAVQAADGRPVHIGPITLARRFNAVATSPPLSPQANAEQAVDPLLDTAFAASWTLGSIAALSQPGVASLCYYETYGARGVEDHGDVKPVGVLLAQLAAVRGAAILRADSPADLAAIAVPRRHGAADVWIADLSGQSRTIDVRFGSVVQAVELPPWGSSQMTITA